MKFHHLLYKHCMYVIQMLCLEITLMLCSRQLHSMLAKIPESRARFVCSYGFRTYFLIPCIFASTVLYFDINIYLSQTDYVGKDIAIPCMYIMCVNVIKQKPVIWRLSHGIWIWFETWSSYYSLTDSRAYWCWWLRMSSIKVMWSLCLHFNRVQCTFHLVN